MSRKGKDSSFILKFRAKQRVLRSLTREFSMVKEVKIRSVKGFPFIWSDEGFEDKDHVVLRETQSPRVNWVVYMK